MINIKHFILLTLFIVIALPGPAQKYSGKEIELIERLDTIAKNVPPELAYIQTSKDIYETGEDLWFKVYLLDAQFLTPSDMSNTLYLQLLNEASRKVVWQEKYEILNGTSNGKVYLESSLTGGDYLLAAYTPNSFFNDTTEFKAVRRIKVTTDVTSQKTDTLKSKQSLSNKPKTKNSDYIQFNTFPEGGDLVSGIQSKLAFKAVNINGEPVDVAGKLFEGSDVLFEFRSGHAGMGSFSFTPQTGKKYFIRLSEPATDSTYLLPDIYPSGITMQLVRRDKESLSFKISQSPGLDQDDIYLRVQCRGVVYGTTKAKSANEIYMKIPLSRLPQGIAEVTLFNSSLEPLAERLVYINSDRKLNITTGLSKEIFATRGKASLKIIVQDEYGQPVVANLGVTIFDRLYQNSRDSNNILSHYYLSAQLKGRIYNPSYYFDGSNVDRDNALDLLMLTQGWRRYIWNEANLKKSNRAFEQVIFDGIKGELFYPHSKNKIPKEQTFVMAFSPNKDSVNVLIPADSAGRFTVSEERLKEWENDYVYLKPFGFGSWGSRPVYRRTSPETPEYNLHIKLTDPFETIDRCMRVKKIIYPLNSLINIKEKLTDLPSEYGFTKIPAVTIHGQKVKAIRGKFMGTIDSLTKYDLYLDYVCEFGVLNCPRHDRYEFGTTKPVPGNWYYQIIAYNTPAEHVISVVYQPPNFNEDELLKMSNLSRVKAYYSKREFYKPNYDKDKGDDLVPDFRNTLLWEPEVITDENGEATLSFFCSDINTDFVGRIEGVGGEGLLGTGDFKFTVRKLTPTP